MIRLSGEGMKNIHMKRIVFGIFLVLSFLSNLHAQFDAQSSQYMHNAPGFNPAAVGETGMLDVTGQHRLHWIGMPNGGSTTVFNINSPLNILGRKHGIGINFINDQVGLFVNQQVHLQYAFKFRVGKGTLNIGPQIGFLSIGFRGDSVRGPLVPTGEYHDIQNDPAIPASLVEGFALDMSLGGWYTQQDFYAGISYSHFNQPVIEWTDQHEYRPTSTFYITGGYSKTLSNPRYVFKPSMLLKTDFTTYKLDLSALMYINNQYWGGLTYLHGDAAVILAGINIGNGLSIGYSFDIPVSQMIRATWSSHEVMLSYEIDIKTGDTSRRKKYKSIRIL
jgi:type IX secretion system PorP/SprF family membrane protein